MATVNFEDPMNFGMGMDSLQLVAKHSNAVETDTLTGEAGGGAQTVEFSFLRVETIEDYQDSITISADASVTYGLFHASAAFDFAQKHKFHSYSKYLIASIAVTNEFKQIANPRLSQSGQTVIGSGDEHRFFEEFGDTFVLGIKTGGMYHAVLEFTSKSESDLQNISAALDVGTYGLFDASSTFTSAVEKFQGQTSLSVTSFQQGGVDLNPTINVDQIVKKATSLPDEVRVRAKPHTAFLQSYKTLDLERVPNFVDFENAKLVLQRFFRLRNQIVQALNDIEYVRVNPTQFENPQNFPFQEAEDALTNALFTLTQSASQCVNDVKACRFVPVTIPFFELPKRVSGGGGAAPSPRPAPPPLDSITLFAIGEFYPTILPQIKTELPHSSVQVQSDAALGLALQQAEGIAVGNGPTGLPSSADINSPIIIRSNAKFSELQPDIVTFGLANLPDQTPEQVKAGGLSGFVARGMALRRAMAELGQDVSRITFP